MVLSLMKVMVGVMLKGEGVGDGLDDSVFDVEDLLGNSSEDDLF